MLYGIVSYKITFNKKVQEMLERLLHGLNCQRLQQVPLPQTPLPHSHDSLSPYLIFQNFPFPTELLFFFFLFLSLQPLLSIHYSYS